MTNIRRYDRNGQIYFLTHVTYKRMPILIDHIDLFVHSQRAVIDPSGAECLAWVVLPDHFHLLIDPKENDLSRLMQRFKLKFSGMYRERLSRPSCRVWQYRFWDHVIRDTADLNRHIDYIHFNPVKHHAANDPLQYGFSSYKRYFEQGAYSRDWGCHLIPDFDGEFGE